MNKPEVYDKVMAINVDVQNDFCPGGKLGVTEGNLVVPILNKVNRWVRKNEGHVVFTGDWHPKGSKHFKEQGGPWDEHCIQYTAGAAFPDELELLRFDTVAYKGTGMEDDGYSGWQAGLTHDSPLYAVNTGRISGYAESVKEAVEEEANVYGVKRKRIALLIGGLATDYCVKATVLDALKRDDQLKERSGSQIGVFVLSDAIRAVDIEPGDGNKAIKEMKAAGAIFVTSQEVLDGKILEVEAA